MKKSISLLLILLSLEGYSQITLDFQNSNTNLVHIKLNNSETKYIDHSQVNYLNQFSIYNIDCSFDKTIHLPPKPDTSAYIIYLFNISTSLFDNDPSTIEYLVCYIWDSVGGGSYSQSKVIREDGTILLNEMNVQLNYGDPVYNTENGTKLILYYQYANGSLFMTKVFNLPGEIPSSLDEEKNNMNNHFIVYPNPNSGSFFVNFHGNNGDFNIIDLYSVTGKLIDTYKSNNNLIHINNYGLSEGMYLLNNRHEKINSTTKMIIKK